MRKGKVKTTGRAAQGIVYIDRYILTPAIACSYIGPVHMGTPFCSSPSVRSDQGARSRRSPHRENAENLWASGQWLGRYWNTVQIWEWEVLGSCMPVWARFRKKPTRCHFSERNRPPGFLGRIPTPTSLEQPRGGVWTFG